ncbi:SCP-like protein, partial [Oesophagostomum dentatum]
AAATQAKKEQQDAEAAATQAKKEQQDAEAAAARAKKQQQDAEAAAARAKKQQQDAEAAAAQAKKEKEEAEAAIAQAKNKTENVHSNPAINQICPKNFGVNDKIRKHALDAHNWRRSMLALGNALRNDGSKMPSAANMMQLKYDCALEISARRRAAESCVKTENSDSKVQENLHVVPRAKTKDRPDAMRQSIIEWWKQVKLDTPIGDDVTFKVAHKAARVRSFTR